jgi:hypothetical protein
MVVCEGQTRKFMKEDASMEICFTYGGRLHCFFVPILSWPIIIPKPGPGPVNYPAFLSDAFLVASLHSMVQHVSDQHVRQSLEGGISAALEALRKHIGSEVTIKVAAAK